MSEDKDTLLERLNAVLSWELAGTIQYLHHHSMVAGTAREEYEHFFHEGSEEARDHAELVANKITALGGVPTVEPAPVKQASSLNDMLEATLELEEKALEAWESALEVGAAYNLGTKLWIEDMIIEEQEHVDELRKITRRIARRDVQEGSDAEQAS